jgi:hypothetical protein
MLNPLVRIRSIPTTPERDRLLVELQLVAREKESYEIGNGNVLKQLTNEKAVRNEEEQMVGSFTKYGRKCLC